MATLITGTSADSGQAVPIGLSYLAQIDVTANGYDNRSACSLCVNKHYDNSYEIDGGSSVVTKPPSPSSSAPPPSTCPSAATLVAAFYLANPGAFSGARVAGPIVCSGSWTGTQISDQNQINALYHWNGSHWVWDDKTQCSTPPLPATVKRTCGGN